MWSHMLYTVLKGDGSPILGLNSSKCINYFAVICTIYSEYMYTTSTMADSIIYTTVGDLQRYVLHSLIDNPMDKS